MVHEPSYESLQFPVSLIYPMYFIDLGKAVPLQAWSGPEGSRKLSFPDLMTTAQEVGKVVSLTHRSHLPEGNPSESTPGP